MLSKKYCPIGVDLGSGYLRVAQLGMNGEGLFLHAAGLEAKPAEIETGSPDWQRWAVEAIRKILKQDSFKGKGIITALPADDVFMDRMGHFHKIHFPGNRDEGEIQSLGCHDHLFRDFQHIAPDIDHHASQALFIQGLDQA